MDRRLDDYRDAYEARRSSSHGGAEWRRSRGALCSCSVPARETPVLDTPAPATRSPNGRAAGYA